jgi:hypothetical protein
MFTQFKKIDNESGVILFIVLMTAIIIMIFSVGILTQSINETNYAQQQIDQIISDQLAKGYFWNAYSANILTGAGPNIGISTVMQGRNYQVNLIYGGTSQGIGTWNTVVNYDTF